MNIPTLLVLIVSAGLFYSFGAGSVFAEEKCAGLAGAKAMVSVIDQFLEFADTRQKDLGLKDEQIRQLRATGLAVKKDLIKGEADGQLAWLDLQTLLHADKPDLAAIEAKLKQIEGTRTGIYLGAIKARLEATAMLAPEGQETVRKWWRQAFKEAGKGQQRAGHDSEMAAKHADDAEKQTRKP